MEVDEAAIEEEFLLEEGQAATPRTEDIVLFRRAYVNEKLSPDLLPYEQLLVQNIKRFIAAQVNHWKLEPQFDCLRNEQSTETNN